MLTLCLQVNTHTNYQCVVQEEGKQGRKEGRIDYMEQREMER